MASAYQKRGRWYLSFKNARGAWTAEACSASTKTEARRLADDLERKAERERRGLEKGAGPAAEQTVAWLLEWWRDTYSEGLPSHKTNLSALKTHLLPASIAAVRVGALTSGDVEQFLHDRSRVLAAETVNHLRGYLSRAFNAARKAGLYNGQSPVPETSKRRVPRRKPDYLRAHEVGPVLAALSERWRPLFATAIYAGLRKGELAALQKQDVDLDTRLLTVQRSWDRDVTKGGHSDTIPIAAELVPYLQTAIDRSPSMLLFPSVGGSMMKRGTQLEAVLRRALRRAGIVTGYVHKCRREGCGYKEAASDAVLRRCPSDNRKLWACASVRPIRFHDTRHTCASLLMQTGANPAAVQRILRHSDPKTTTEIYGHLAPGYLRAEVDRLRFGAAPAVDQPEVAAGTRAAVSGAVFYPVSTGTPAARSSLGEGDSKTPVVTGASSGAGYRVRTDDIQLGKGIPVPSTTSAGSVAVGFLRELSGPNVRGSRLVAPDGEPFSTRFLPGTPPTVGPALRLHRGGRDVAKLLTVAEVADRLGVSPATVYKLCNRGELIHARVLNVIRIDAADLTAFVAARRAPKLR